MNRRLKVIADKTEALMCAAGEKVAYGGHRSRLSRACPLRPKSRRKGEARLGHSGQPSEFACRLGLVYKAVELGLATGAAIRAADNVCLPRCCCRT
jgi:hypothetical protein